jgi:hypothetical protein
VSVRIEIQCDGCGRRYLGGVGIYRPKIHLVRAELRENYGWLTSHHGGQDFCEDCRNSDSKKGIRMYGQQTP